MLKRMWLQILRRYYEYQTKGLFDRDVSLKLDSIIKGLGK
jgi:hypothetical protein